MTMKWMLFPLLSILLQIYYTQSCSTLTREGVSLTGVCPNDTAVRSIPVGGTAVYRCEYNSSGPSYVFVLWNITGFGTFLFTSPPDSQLITAEPVQLVVFGK